MNSSGYKGAALEKAVKGALKQMYKKSQIQRYCNHLLHDKFKAD
jgi:hypothetical protein